MRGELRAICFDLDNTFWDAWPVLERAEQCLQDWLLANMPRLAARYPLAAQRDQRLQLARANPRHAHDVTWLRSESLRRLAVECGYGADLAAAAFAVFLAERQRVEIYTDVHLALPRLHGRMRLATLTNGNADLEAIGLAGYFEQVLTARDVGAAKPDAEAFLAAANRLGIEPARIAYVGDEPMVDVVGARAAGMRAVWINRLDKRWPEELVPPDLQVRDLDELADLLL
ncbi:MAG: HAD family hydrolase [Steroidobacteraceae bacterium]